ncbi:helix-turn-helix domain-containing protein [uncultured Algibacter sp.]|uniref:helix-turn-helix domain-containing protein n=1 Tax=uncultured Algibacter sp. TaxID=298659 RepID=UPI002638F940|nr:helix-turn-helix domain-containing protein [uncultured Algibacter sp.]
MKLKAIHIIFATIICMFYACDTTHSQDYFSEKAKVALRDVGHNLLLLNNDSHSLILPISQIDQNKFEITFENTLEITPDSLVNTISTILKNAKLPKRYVVEVLDCKTKEVSYSFKISGIQEESIVPCSGRTLPNNCYKISVLFLENESFFYTNSPYILLTLVLIVLSLVIGFIYKHRILKNSKKIESPFLKIGAYKFFKEQNKIITDTVEINLSKKECELIAILSTNQNRVVKREILVKEIWEDHGVFVDRSLDTFISKLRKKFKDDPTINIVNIHGVGYKLEVN